jgi:hypothetical protein
VDPNMVTRSAIRFGTALTMHPPLSISVSAIQFPIGQLRQRGEARSYQGDRAAIAPRTPTCNPSSTINGSNTSFVGSLRLQ